MTPLKHIRTRVFAMNQTEFSQRLNVTQSTISKAEQRATIPAPMQIRIRDLARSTGQPWNDSWLFEVPTP